MIARAVLASVLVELGVRRGDRVAIYIDKSIEALVAIYGISRAGACYVPLDPQAPPARLGYIAADADIRVLLTGTEKAADWPPLIAEGAPLESVVVLNTDEGVEAPAGTRLITASDVARTDAAAQPRGGDDSDLAYILYTSGSTGTPKGVMLTHRNCLAFVEWAVERVRRLGRTTACRATRRSTSTCRRSTSSRAALAGAPVVLVPARDLAVPGRGAPVHRAERGSPSGTPSRRS